MLKAAIQKFVPSYGRTEVHALVQQAMDATKFTPDIDVLEQYEWQLIFVQDEHKRDHIHNYMLGKEQQYKFPAFTQQNFRFWDNNDPTEPRVPMLEKSNGVYKDIMHFPPVAKIKGEVFAIRPTTFLTLDPHWQNTVQFYRERVRLVVPYRKIVWLKDKSLWPLSPDVDPEWRLHDEHCHASIAHTREKTCIIRAWMYIGKPEFWDPILSAYDWHAVEHHNSNKRRWCETYYNVRRPSLRK